MLNQPKPDSINSNDIIIKSVNENSNVFFTKDNQLLKYTKDKIYYHFGSLHAGQTLICDCDIIIIGNVNPGAEVHSSGNITVCGRANGMLYAGKDSNDDAIICARSINPSYVSIGKHKAHGSKEVISDDISAELAKVDNGTITIVNIF